MNTSVRTKVQKKQSTSQQAKTDYNPRLEHCLMSLESACVRVMESRFSNGRHDTDGLYWQQRFNNIVTPISLALREHRGPRRFHYHYRHRADDDAILHPVLEPSPVETLAQVCKQALRYCQSEIVGVHDDKILRIQYMLENALRNFLVCFKETFTAPQK